MNRAGDESLLRNADRADNGVAMIMVIAWSAVLIIMALGVGQVIVNQTAVSDQNESSFKAISAAEAGLDDFRARLAVSSRYYQTQPPTDGNKAYGAWRTVDADTTCATSGPRTCYQYTWQQPSASTGGDVVLKSTGMYADGRTTVKRTIEAHLSRRTSYDYAFFSSLNTQLPTWPGAYKDTGTSIGVVGQAQLLCNRWWWVKGQTEKASGASTSDWHRNSRFCTFPQISSNNRYFGPIHTNDIWYIFDDGSGPTTYASGTASAPLNRDPLATHVTGQVFNGRVTSSCAVGTPASSDGGAGLYNTGEPGCPASMQWVNAASGGLNNSSDPGAQLNKYTKNEFTMDGAYPLISRLWNPTYSPPVEFAHSFNEAKLNVDMKAKAQISGAGCLFMGPTRIRFSGSTVYVTSPDTKTVNASCGGDVQFKWWSTTSTADPTKTNDQLNVAPDMTKTGQSMTTGSFTIPANTDFVIYVQDVPNDTSVWGQEKDPTGAGAFPKSIDTTNGAAGSNNTLRSLAPTCRFKNYPSGSYPDGYYPFVVPQQSTEINTTRYSGGLNKGFPTEKATGADYWSDGHKCTEGTLYVEGNYSGQITLASEGDTVLTGNLVDSTSPTTFTAPSTANLPTNYGRVPGDDLLYGRPATSSTSILGLVPQQMLYFFNPQGTEASIWTQQQNWIFNGATLSLSECVAVQGYENSGKLGDLTVVGALGQNYSCNLTGPGNSTTGGGFGTMTIAYDARYLFLKPPPYFDDLFFEPWVVKQINEVRDHVA